MLLVRDCNPQQKLYKFELNKAKSLQILVQYFKSLKSEWGVPSQKLTFHNIYSANLVEKLDYNPNLIDQLQIVMDFHERFLKTFEGS